MQIETTARPSPEERLALRKERLQRLLSLMPEEADALFVSSELHQRYLTDFDSTDGFVLVFRNSAPVFVTDSRYREAAEAAGCAPYEIRLHAGKPFDQVRALMQARDITALAYEDDAMSCAAYRGMKAALPGFTLLPAGRIFHTLRSFKSRAEIACIRHAQAIAEAAFEDFLPCISTDRTEQELAAELEYRMRLHGAEGFAFDTIAVSGTASSLPHGVPRNVKAERGFFTFDFGAKYCGYCSDMTRTVCIGTPTAEMRRVYQTVLDAQEAAIAAITARKVDCGGADRVAREHIEAAGYGKYFGHSLGHGVGLFIHELPVLSANGNSVPLLPGQVVTVEPGIYLPGRFGVRIEDMLAVTEEGAENLTRTKKALLVL